MATSKEKSGASRKSESEKRAEEAKKAEEARKAAEVAEEDDEEEDDEEEDEELKEVSAVPARAARRRAAEPADEAEEEEELVEDEDPYWWTPHLALSAIVIIGILGFFGVFNKTLGPHIPKPLPATAFESDEPEKKAATETAPKPAEPPQARPRPGATMNPNQPDAPSFGAKHLLVQYKGSMRAAPTITRSKDDAKKRATEARDKAKKPGAKFEDIVKEYSDEPGADKRGGDLGTFRKGQMVPQFQDAVEKMKVGEISDLVETPFGYHVILRTK
jgi:parvulin-like peptidyl-prolyl isomerase